MAGNLKSILAEFIGTFALVLIGAGAVCMDVITGGKIGWVGIALAQGFILTVMLYTYGPVSGGHFNPAVTLGMLLVRRINLIKGIFYTAAQLLGAALAALCLKAALHNIPDLSSAAPFLGACDLTPEIGYKAATLLEAVATFFLVSAYAASSQPRGVGGTGPIAPIAIGMTWSVCMLAIGPMTGAALNPARAFGPSVATGHWTYGFVYWIGPLAGGLAASWIHENIYLEKKK